MRRISESERQRILELHNNTPMKPFIFEQPTLNVGPGGVITRNEPFDSQRYGERLVKMGATNTTTPTVQQSQTLKAIYGNTPKDERGTKEFQDRLEKERQEATKWKPTHTQLEILAMASMLIPIVGPLLSIAIELTDIEMYVKEKDYYGAGLFTIFLAIPLMEFVPPQVKQIIKNWSKDKVKTLVKKLRIGGKLDDGERVVVDYFNNNTEQIGRGLDDLARPKVNQMILDPSMMRGGTTIQLPIDVLQKIGKGGLRVANFLAPLIYIPVAYDAAVKSGDYLATKFREQLHGESLLTKIEKAGPAYIVRAQFGTNGSQIDEKKLMDMLSDTNATDCGFWKINRPIPIKYQTDTYKRQLNMERIKTFIEDDEKTDCLFPGTFGKPLKPMGDIWEYKYINGKFQTKKRKEFDWIPVTDENMIKAIEKVFASNGLTKNQKLGIYEK